MQKNGCELGLFILLVLIACALLNACSFQVGIDWQGETKKDNRTYSGDKK